MKKMFVSTLIVILVSLLVVVPAFAKTTVVKGEVTALDLVVVPPTITVLTNQGETLTIDLPEGFDGSTLAVGDKVLIKGEADAEGKLVAETIRIVGKGNVENTEGSKSNSAYCDPEKQDKLHPFAVKIAEKYGVTPEWVMGYYCDGIGMGQIMLALKTGEKVKGSEGAVTPDDLLKARTDGKGWGKIWQELKLVGSEKSTEAPADQLKNAEHGKPNK